MKIERERDRMAKEKGEEEKSSNYCNIMCRKTRLTIYFDIRDGGRGRAELYGPEPHTHTLASFYKMRKSLSLSHPGDDDDDTARLRIGFSTHTHRKRSKKKRKISLLQTLLRVFSLLFWLRSTPHPSRSLNFRDNHEGERVEREVGWPLFS